jgi:hypothetical protein
MSHGRPSRSRSLPLLLLALAIQAIAPDGQDLASIQALQRIAPGLTDFDSPLQQDEWPDDVCEPAPSASRVAAACRKDLGSPLIFGLAIARPQTQLVEDPSISGRTRHRVPSAVQDPLRSLGRMIC